MKLTPDQVRSIKKEYKKGVVGYTTLGKKYGVNRHTILRIVRGENWKWI